MISPWSRVTSRARTIVLIVVLAVGIVVVMAPIIGAAAALKLPEGVSSEFAYSMYGEQVESADSIGELVDGTMESFEILETEVTSTTAALDLRVALTNGTTRSGVMNLANAGGAWYFESISRTGDTEASAFESEPDIGVLNTMLAEQSQNTSLTAQLVDGTFDAVTVGTPKKGFRSTTIPVTFTGAGEPVKGKVTAVKRVQDGRTQWFIVSFR